MVVTAEHITTLKINEQSGITEIRTSEGEIRYALLSDVVPWLQRWQGQAASPATSLLIESSSMLAWGPRLHAVLRRFPESKRTLRFNNGTVEGSVGPTLDLPPIWLYTRYTQLGRVEVSGVWVELEAHANWKQCRAFHWPWGNVNTGGAVCWGGVNLSGSVTADDLIEMFLTSQFNRDLRTYDVPADTERMKQQLANTPGARLEHLLANVHR